MFLVGVLLLVIVAAVLAAVAYGATRNKRSFAKQNEVVAGTPSQAPAAWAGAHTPEALLHRRLRGAVDAARAHLATPGSGLDDVVAAIGRGAQEVDGRLIAAAALPATSRAQAIAEVEPAVVALENAVAGLTSSSLGPEQAAVTAAVADVQDRLGALAEARAEVDLADAATPQAMPQQQPGQQQPGQQQPGQLQPGQQPPVVG